VKLQSEVMELWIDFVVVSGFSVFFLKFRIGNVRQQTISFPSVRRFLTVVCGWEAYQFFECY
jgi:hypothetical protein